MSRHAYLAMVVGGVLVLTSCSDTTVEESVAGTPRLNAGQGTTHCDGALPPGAYANIIVLPNGTCTLHDVTVIRDVKVLPGAHLVMTNFDVAGSVEGNNPGQIIMQAGSVGNDIRIKGGASPGFGASIHSTLVERGDIEVEKMETGIIFMVFNQVPNGRIYVADNTTEVFLQVAANNVAQTLDVFRNSGPSPKVVDANTAGVAVRCQGNSEPFLGGPNVAPSREGQCF